MGSAQLLWDMNELNEIANIRRQSCVDLTVLMYQLCSVTLTVMTQLIIITDKSCFLTAAANHIRQELHLPTLATLLALNLLL